MPVYNVVDFVADAARSVAEQTWSDITLIAIDDGSSDGTAQVLEALPEWDRPGRQLILIRQDNAGASAARNRGLAAADGAFIAFIDGDDRWHPTLLTRLVGLLDAAPDLDLAFPRYRYIDANDLPTGWESRPKGDRFSVEDLMCENPIHSASGVVVRAEAVAAVGRFDETLTACIDLDYWVRINRLRPRNLGIVPELLVDYRKREGQITGNWRRMRSNWQRVRDKLAEAGTPLSPAELNRSRARRSLYWGSIAYESGDFGAARRLVAETWVRDPVFAARDPLARIRALSCLATLLPRPLHDRVRAGYNTVRNPDLNS